MHIKNKIMAVLLAMLLCVLQFTAVSLAAADEKTKRAEIEALYESARSTYQQKTGRGSFYGNCGIYMSYLLNALGIDSYLGGHNGNQWFDAYTDGQRLGDYTVVKFSGANCIQNVAAKYGEINYVMVSYTHQTRYTDENPGAGHVFFINTISDGKAYFTESYAMYDYTTRSYISEGKSVVMPIEDIAADHESLYGKALGALVFIKDGTVLTTAPAETTEITTVSAETTEITTAPAELTTAPTIENNDPELEDKIDAVIREIPYTADKESFIISGISEKTTVAEFSAALPGIDVTVWDGTGAPVAANTRIGTGMAAELVFAEVKFVFALSVRGDVNGDGKVSSVDARTALRYSARLTTEATDAQLLALDMNGDGKVKTADARLILRTAARIA
ncbi:MAG: dockerin type I repeat-containing protein [Clostridia bacterium]|nr:dockerin type I repeat-containing protein [Clostridia bacterium]